MTPKNFLNLNNKTRKRIEIQVEMQAHIAVNDGYINGKKYSFGIDCGAEACLINQNVKNEIITELTNEETAILLGVDKNSTETPYV